MSQVTMMFNIYMVTKMFISKMLAVLVNQRFRNGTLLSSQEINPAINDPPRLFNAIRTRILPEIYYQPCQRLQDHLCM